MLRNQPLVRTTYADLQKTAAYENAIAKIRELGGHVKYPCLPPSFETLEYNGERLKSISCKIST